jgi:hypothetical protein
MNSAIAALSNLHHLGVLSQPISPQAGTETTSLRVVSPSNSANAVLLCCKSSDAIAGCSVTTADWDMNPLRSRVHHLIDQLLDEEVESLWPVLEALYYDFYMIRAIEESKQTLQPGDTLTREEALRSLPLL